MKNYITRNIIESIAFRKLQVFYKKCFFFHKRTTDNIISSLKIVE